MLLYLGEYSRSGQVVNGRPEAPHPIPLLLEERESGARVRRTA
jgi:hypothetical protein